MQEEVKSANWTEIDIEKKVFRKHMPLAKFESELAMTQKAHELSINSSLFNTPKVLEVNKNENTVEFELIKEATTFRVFYNKQLRFGISTRKLNQLSLIFNKIGQALHEVHQSKNHFDSVKKQSFPLGFLSDSFQKDEVYIHGDFTMNNILFSESNQQIHIIDWNTSPVFDFSANYGSRFWDLSFFISSMYYYSITSRFSHNSRKVLANAFVNGYLKNYKSDEVDFLNNLKQFLNSYNYYKLYDTIHQERSNVLHKYLIRISKRKLQQYANGLSSML